MYSCTSSGQWGCKNIVIEKYTSKSKLDFTYCIHTGTFCDSSRKRVRTSELAYDHICCMRLDAQNYDLTWGLGRRRRVWTIGGGGSKPPASSLPAKRIFMCLTRSPEANILCTCLSTEFHGRPVHSTSAHCTVCLLEIISQINQPANNIFL
jgi:hypothetical protein